MHAWLTVQMLWQMHGGTLQAVYKLIVYKKSSLVSVQVKWELHRIVHIGT